MKCLLCGSLMKEHREDFDYSICGLPVVLAGLTVRRCTECAEFEAVIPRIEDLHAAIAEIVTRKKTRLLGEEVRYLRSWLGLSGRRFAHRVAVEPETVSRWENNKKPIGEAEERLLRLMVAQKQFFVDYEALLDADYSDAVALTSLEGRVRGERWELSAA